MKLDAFGKRMEVARENDQWVIYELGEGKKTRSSAIYIPAEYDEEKVLQFLNDLFHESATPTNPSIKVID